MHQGLEFASSVFSGALNVSAGGLLGGSVDLDKAVQKALAA